MKKVLIAGLGVMAVASAAMGEEVKATKKAAIMTPIENLYGRAEVRHTSERKNEANGDVTQKVKNYKLITRIGTTAYNGRLNMYINSPLVNNARTGTFEQGQSDYAATFSALDTGLVSVTPLVYGAVPFKNSRQTVTAGLNVDVSHSVDTSAGKLSFHGGVEPELLTGTKTKQTDAQIVKGGTLTLNDDGKAASKKVDNKEPVTVMEYFAGIGFTPSAAPKFTLSADTYFDRKYSPVYEAVQDEVGEHVEKTGYAVSDSVLTDLVVAYKADALTTVSSRTLISNDGFHVGRPNVEQRISLTHKLF